MLCLCTNLVDLRRPSGTLCANFARDHLPDNLQGALHQYWCELVQRRGMGGKSGAFENTWTESECDEALYFQKALSSAFTKTNQQLHDSEINDNRSGTTAVVVLLYGELAELAGTQFLKC